MLDVSRLFLVLPAILVALTVHEYAHGWVAWKFGDPTAKQMGRLTLNPLAHLDPVGTIMLLLFYFGWAKPVPVDPRNFKNPRKAMVWVALAGPGANVITALILGLTLQLLLGTGMVRTFSSVYVMIAFAIFINLMLAFFNLIPIPPLDGSRVVEGYLPIRYLAGWERFTRFGWVILIGLILMGRLTGVSIFGVTIFPLSKALFSLFTGGAPFL